MMNKIFGFIIIFSILCSFISGKLESLSQAAFKGASGAVELSISLLGAMCLWCGLMNILEKSGMSKIICNFIMPLLKVIFPKVPAKSPAMRAISMNMAANFLGLSNAATPFGIKAMEQLQLLNNNSDKASAAMSMFVVINTASIQLIPSTLIALRILAGSKDPFGIILPVWCASACAVTVGICVASFFERMSVGRKK